MKYQVQEIRDNLLKLKSVYTSKGYSDVYNYVYFYDNRMWASNGFFLISVPSSVKESFMVPAVPLEEQLKVTKESEFEIKVSPIDIEVTIGKKKNVFAINDNFDTYVRKYGIGYVPDDEPVEVKANIQDILDFCGKTVYKDSVSYSYVYVEDNLAFSSDSFRISFMKVDDGISGLKLPFGTRKHIADPVDFIFYNDDTVTFFMGDTMLTASLQEVDGSKIKEFNRKTIAAPVEVVDVSSVVEFLRLSKKMTKEYKALDQVVTVSVDKDVMIVSAGDSKGMVTEEMSVSSKEKTKFKVHPSYFEEALKISSTFYVDDNSIVFFNEDRKQYISVEECV